MQRLEDFRIYYNHTIHPELMRLERKRLRLLLLLGVSVFLMGGVIIVSFYINILPIILALLVVLGLYASYLLYRIRAFIKEFKPKVVNLVLDFIDDGVNYGTLSYEPETTIPRSVFLGSRIFVSLAPIYHGEDYIKGHIGSVKFELCELLVSESSRVRGGFFELFRGIFLHATFQDPLRGEVLILPRESVQYFSRSIRGITARQGENMDKWIQNAEFKDMFTVYATKDMQIRRLLSDEMGGIIADYAKNTNKEIFLSFIDNEIYVAVSEPKDILEPYIFQSNVSFELVREFWADLNLLLSIIEDFDVLH
jgi:hypothetical protein